MKRYRHVGRRVAVLGLTGAAVVAVAASPAFAKSEVGLSVTPRVVHAGQSVHVNASGGNDAYPSEELCLDAHRGAGNNRAVSTATVSSFLNCPGGRCGMGVAVSVAGTGCRCSRAVG